MPKFSRKSLERLQTCDPKLEEIAAEAIKIVDFSVLWGFRDREMQNKYFREGTSKVEWPKSKHNTWLSEAIDVLPWPTGWENRERFFFVAGVFLSIAKEKGVELVWGGAWLGGFNTPKMFDDLAHFELK